MSNGISDGLLRCVGNNSYRTDAEGLSTNRVVPTEPESEMVVIQIDLPEDKSKDNQNEQTSVRLGVPVDARSTAESEGTNGLEGENGENLVNIESTEEKSVMTDSIRRSERSRQPP
ncbi:hypothetical protein AMECASPLE_039746 [Ameca splendens]|uniref:Uncharacterized protein n=1 Tax=Ameca splendens TaxID=208324 RepID=A0ABV0YJN7_9TELE